MAILHAWHFSFCCLTIRELTLLCLSSTDFPWNFPMYFFSCKFLWNHECLSNQRNRLVLAQTITFQLITFVNIFFHMNRVYYVLLVSFESRKKTYEPRTKNGFFHMITYKHILSYESRMQTNHVFKHVRSYESRINMFFHMNQ